MRSSDTTGGLGIGSVDPDLTARARIRDAAIEVFVRDGFSASIRAVAAQAHVSPGLVIHHFASKAGLRAACDARVLDMSRERTGDVLGRDYSDPVAGGSSSAVSETLRSLAEGGPLLVYVTRILTEGGDSARSFIERLVVGTEDSMRVAVDSGVVRPSIDETARARYLVAVSLGVLMIDLAMNPPPDPTDGAAIFREHAARNMIPATEYATHGLFTDTAALDAVLAIRSGNLPGGIGDPSS